MAARNNASAQAAQHELIITRVFDAPRSLVFEVWSKPEHLEQWCGPRGFTIPFGEMDFRPGGAWRSCLRGLEKLQADPSRMAAELEANWEVLAEAVQTVMRRYGVANAYEQLKVLTRGKGITREGLAEFIRGLPIPEAEKQRLLKLTPGTYTGKAVELAKRV